MTFTRNDFHRVIEARERAMRREEMKRYAKDILLPFAGMVVFLGVVYVALSLWS